MSQRDLFYKWLFYVLLAVGWTVLQQAALNHLPLWSGVHPFLWPMLPIAVAILEPRQACLLFAAASGLLCDLLSPGVIPCFYTLTFLLCALLSGVIARRVIVPGFLCAFVCSVLAFVVTDLLLILFLTSSTAFSGAEAFSLMGRELLISLPLFAPIFFSFRQIFRRMRNQ